MKHTGTTMDYGIEDDGNSESGKDYKTYTLSLERQTLPAAADG